MDTGSDQSISKIRHIDNSRLWLPILTTFLIVFLFAIFIWFFRGGSFRLYSSIFFTLYNFTGQIWISVLLMGVLQNIAFLPLRLIGDYFDSRIKVFEELLGKSKENDQYFMFTEKIKKGDPAIVFYIFNFILNAIAFFSAGRIFLIDFYNTPLDPKLLYNFVPYPKYPLRGTDFRFPFFKVTDSMALDWLTIAKIWIGITLFFAAARFLWRLIKFILWRSKRILSARINYNRLLAEIGGFSGTLFIVSTIFLRHIPTAFQGVMLIADLTRQNSTMNLITAIGTFLTTFHAGYNSASKASDNARRASIPEDVINKVFKARMERSFKNAIFLGIGAYIITSNIPSAFELSVATFEVLYIVSPYALKWTKHS